ncbi:prevent-host-death protein [Sulfurovum lithotrophicum]|uniref:Antitoxin n=1 Tax=Sulfurovum lithotrophicum TaxID=206403 RepID=A0A7U4M1I7_9BACT|nr:type II toxin-antitoxin system Phd/YefM family antitoxin [Sulfurovum lithotrophicum]AKF25163.1 prevent-host-death protein [Sulfurovum lithotrophicum]
MNLSQDIKPISFLKAKTADVINTVTETQRSMIITQNGEAKAVVQDIKSYENLQNSLALLKMIIKSERQIREGKLIRQAEVFDQIEEKYFK